MVLFYAHAKSCNASLCCVLISPVIMWSAVMPQYRPVTMRETILLITGFVLTVQRYWPPSSGFTSWICKFQSLTFGLTTLNRASSMTLRSSRVSGIVWYNQATYTFVHAHLILSRRWHNIIAKGNDRWSGQNEGFDALTPIWRIIGLNWKIYDHMALYLVPKRWI